MQLPPLLFKQDRQDFQDNGQDRFADSTTEERPRSANGFLKETPKMIIQIFAFRINKEKDCDECHYQWGIVDNRFCLAFLPQ
jgi:hypothetical protein